MVLGLGKLLRTAKANGMLLPSVAAGRGSKLSWSRGCPYRSQQTTANGDGCVLRFVWPDVLRTFFNCVTRQKITLPHPMTGKTHGVNLCQPMMIVGGIKICCRRYDGDVKSLWAWDHPTVNEAHLP